MWARIPLARLPEKKGWTADGVLGTFVIKKIIAATCHACLSPLWSRHPREADIGDLSVPVGLEDMGAFKVV